jgi:LysM repeat protein
MKDGPELQMNDDPPDDRIYSPERRRIESDSNRLLPAMIVVLLVLIFAVGIYYFITRRPAESNATLQSKLASLEEKIAGLEKQIVDLQGKSGTGSPDPLLLHRVDALAKKVEELEKRTQLKTELKAKAAPPKAAVTAQKQYHTVQKGETLFKISKKYGITVEELSKLNGLSRSQHVRTGQKLLISAGR